MVSASIAPKGHADAHFLHPLHFCVSMVTEKRLALSVREANAPNGQSVLHCVRRFVRIGSTMTSDRNSPMKITPAISPGIVFIGLNSVTSLNGQNHSQYTADMAPSEASTMNAKKPN